MKRKSRKLAPVVRSPIVKFAHVYLNFCSIAPPRKNNAAFLSHWSKNQFLLQWDKNAALFFLDGAMERKSNCACANSTIGLLTTGASFLDFILNVYHKEFFWPDILYRNNSNNIGRRGAAGGAVLAGLVSGALIGAKARSCQPTWKWPACRRLQRQARCQVRPQ